MYYKLYCILNTKYWILAVIISYYGDGKGKTTAALGLILRASGYDQKILFVQFIKGEFETGEDEALGKIKNLTHKKFGLGFVGIMGDDRDHDEHKNAAIGGLRYVLDHLDSFDIVVLDEVFGAVHGGLIGLSEVLDLVKRCDKIDLVMTGRPKIDELINVSDLVTQMKSVKHPFDRGHAAKRGIDY